MDIDKICDYDSDYRKNLICICSENIYIHIGAQPMCFVLKKEKKDNMFIRLDWIKVRNCGFIYGIHLWKNSLK